MTPITPTIHRRLASDEAEPAQLECAAFQIAWASVRDPLKKTNEDGAIVIDLGKRGVIACVVDGMGGMAGGAEAAAITIDSVRKAFKGEVESRRGALVDGFEAAHAKVVAELRGAAQPPWG